MHRGVFFLQHNIKKPIKMQCYLEGTCDVIPIKKKKIILIEIKQLEK